jgi:hypothetical protein
VSPKIKLRLMRDKTKNTQFRYILWLLHLKSIKASWSAHLCYKKERILNGAPLNKPCDKVHIETSYCRGKEIQVCQVMYILSG